MTHRAPRSPCPGELSEEYVMETLVSDLRRGVRGVETRTEVRARTNMRLLIVAAICATVSVASASYARVSAHEREPTLTVPAARQVLRSEGDWHRRQQAIESLRVRAIEAIDRLELARSDIVLREQAECALASIKKELGQ